ncbi:MAG: alpha-L-fucosidase [Kiritimatiellae bacterium]|nr:alpha-L-fucosidase [Kiritimatiellia bacterium]
MLKAKKPYEAAIAKTRDARMKWWREARYGMFVHWGLYALIGRNEWVQSIEGIPVREYEKLMGRFKPKPRPARDWARLAVESGMKYMVLTTKHHEGFCLWDTRQTGYNAMNACGRDLVREYVEACREFGLKIGFYYSLMDWHHPDGARAAYDPAARRRFLDFTWGCVEELMTKYGKIDILWYDVALPFASDEGWESLAMNQMARGHQPHLLINNRSRLPEDFSTPEGHVKAAEAGRGWEACMTFDSASWGYMPSAAEDSWSPRQILRMLNTACAGGGNLLLNIGPKPDGSVPDAAVKPLTTVGKWLKQNGKAVYGALDRSDVGSASACGAFSRRGSRLFMWCRHWPGEDFALGGFKTRLKKATFMVSGKPIRFEQQPTRILLKGLPKASPDKIAGVTVLELDFEGPPKHARGLTTPALWT